MSDIKKPQGLAMEELKQTVINVINSFQKDYGLKFYTLEPFFTALASSIRDEASKEIQNEEKEYKEAIEKHAIETREDLTQKDE